MKTQISIFQKSMRRTHLQNFQMWVYQSTRKACAANFLIWILNLAQIFTILLWSSLRQFKKSKILTNRNQKRKTKLDWSIFILKPLITKSRWIILKEIPTIIWASMTCIADRSQWFQWINLLIAKASLLWLNLESLGELDPGLLKQTWTRCLFLTISLASHLMLESSTKRRTSSWNTCERRCFRSLVQTLA